MTFSDVLVFTPIDNKYHEFIFDCNATGEYIRIEPGINDGILENIEARRLGFKQVEVFTRYNDTEEKDYESIYGTNSTAATDDWEHDCEPYQVCNTCLDEDQLK